MEENCLHVKVDKPEVLRVENRHARAEKFENISAENRFKKSVIQTKNNFSR
jgi:hypothetical protein